MTVYLVNGPSDDAEGSANPSRSGARPNKLGLWEPGTLKVAVNDGTVPPSDGDTPTIGPDLARALGDQLGLKVELFTVDGPSDMVSGLLNRENEDHMDPGPPAETFDVLMPGAPDDFGRGEEQDMTLIHYLDVGYAVVAPWESAQDIRSKADLCGKNVSLLNHGFVEEAVNKTSTELCGPHSIDAALRTDTLHGYITELPFAVRQARNSDGELHRPKVDLTDDIPLGMAVDRSDTTLRDALNHHGRPGRPARLLRPRRQPGPDGPGRPPRRQGTHPGLRPDRLGVQPRHRHRLCDRRPSPRLRHGLHRPPPSPH
jgi:ABC-type amino acid transport substrate-binding protein